MFNKLNKKKLSIPLIIIVIGWLLAIFWSEAYFFINISFVLIAFFIKVKRETEGFNSNEKIVREITEKLLCIFIIFVVSRMLRISFFVIYAFVIQTLLSYVLYKEKGYFDD